MLILFVKLNALMVFEAYNLGPEMLYLLTCKDGDYL